MHSKCLVGPIIFVSILLIGSCSFLSLSGGKANFMYGGGNSPLSISAKLTKAIASGNSKTAVVTKVIDRYNGHYEVFKIQTGLRSDSKAAKQFESILKVFSPKPGTVNISIKVIETVKEDVKIDAGKFRVKVISKVHIGCADKTLLEKIEKNNELAAELKKTQLFGKIKININNYEKYI